MNKFNVELIESSFSHNLKITPGSKRDYSFREKSGVFRKKRGKSEYMESVELENPGEVKKIFSSGIGMEIFKETEKLRNFDPGLVTKNNEFIVEYLSGIPGLEWEVILKSFSGKKVIIKKARGRKSSLFSHNSILIRFKKKNWNSFIEVGEGNINEKKFNHSGLKNRIEEIIRCNSENDETGLKNRASIGGKVPVVLNSGDGGIIFHEILGHSLEADFIYQKQSPFSLKDLGKKVVSENITLLTRDKNDPFFGNISGDDEGEIPATDVLIEKGRIRSVISDIKYSKLLGIKDKGHSRQEDFSKPTIPRMFSIYLKKGKYDPDELIRSTRSGVYAKEFGEGKVLFHRNLFFFRIPAAFLIKNGKIDQPIGNVVVKGEIKEVFNSVEMVANDFSYDRGISHCFKNGQILNVRVGQPTVKINNLVITRDINGY
ncbi:MAG: TldD/PmbA family protein [Acidobacteriota bacterium]